LGDMPPSNANSISDSRLCDLEGVSTLFSTEQVQLPNMPSTVPSTITSTSKATWFVLRQDETPLPPTGEGPTYTGNIMSGSSLTNTSSSTSRLSSASASPSTAQSVSPSFISPAGSNSYNGYIYPQWTYSVHTTIWGGVFYTQEDPINFAYEPDHNLNNIVNYLINNKGWYDTNNCSNSDFIYDFSAPNPYYKVMDRTVALGGCNDTGSGRYHVRFWIMANGRIAAGAHHEVWSWWCFCHNIDGWDSAENKLASDESGQYIVATDSYNLGNSGTFKGVYNDGAASTVPTTVHIHSYPTTDTILRSHGLSVDQALPNPWWPPYYSGYEYTVQAGTFDYNYFLWVDPGSHFVEEAASGFCPSYCWHTDITISNDNWALGAGQDVARDNHLRVSFTL